VAAVAVVCVVALPAAAQAPPPTCPDPTEPVPREAPGPWDFYLASPLCRAFDSRGPAGAGLPLVAGVPKTIVLTGTCDLPPSAVLVALNVTVTGATAAGHLVLGAADDPPGLEVVHFAAGQSRATNLLVRLSPAGGVVALPVMPSATDTVHLVLDVAGHFRVNTHPVAVGDHFAGDEGTACIVLDPTANDSDADGDALSLIVKTLPISGKLFEFDPSQPDAIGSPVTIGEATATLRLCYRPNKRFFHGCDSFTYQLDDGHCGVSQEAVVNLGVRDINEPGDETTPGQQTLTVTTCGTGTVSGPGISCGSAGTDCTEVFLTCAEVPLVSDVEATEWSGGGRTCLATSTCLVNMEIDRSVSVLFPDCESP
jgi:hypothetical protein